MSYTEIVGDDQYARAAFVFSSDPVNCSAGGALASNSGPAFITSMGASMNDAFNITADELRQLIERIEQYEAEKKDIAEQLKEVYAEAKGRGFDTKALRKIVSLRKQDANERQEAEAMLEVYMTALGMQ